MFKFVDEDSFYPVHDVDLFCDVFGVELLNIKQNWNFIGRPLFIFPWLHWMTGLIPEDLFTIFNENF